MTFESFKRSLHDLMAALDNLSSKNLSLKKPAKTAMVTDFKKSQDDYFRNAVYTGISFVETASRKIDAPPECAPFADQIRALVDRLGMTQDISELKLIVGRIAELAAQIKMPEKTSFSLAFVPLDVQSDINADIDELQRCYSAGCYRSAVILCGRLLETALHRVYFDATGNDLLEKSPGIGLGSLIAKLKEHGVELDPALSNQIHLINQVRIHSVHHKKDVFMPSREQAHAVMLYTLDVLGRLFKK